MAKTNLIVEQAGRAILGGLLIMSGIRLLDDSSVLAAKERAGWDYLLAQLNLNLIFGGMLWTKLHGTVSVIAGIVMVLSRDHGSLVGLVCFALQIL